jgi:hypothetical protein
VREDPVRKKLLYLGTENALYVSFNDGANWLPLQTNLPHAPVHWLVIQEHFNDLVVGTYGRGFWIMDDITPLQQLTPEILKSDIYLFTPRPSYRFRFKSGVMSRPEDPAAGQNPPYGASINYYLKSPSTDDVEITILDEKVQTVKSLRGTNEAGINRVMWDLRYEPSKQIKLRTSPLYAPYVGVGPQGWRSLISGGEQIRPLAAPGNYTVKLRVGTQTFTQKLTVKKDPNSAGSEEDIQTQVKMLLEMRDDSSFIADMVNQIEWFRKQINDLANLLNKDKNNTPDKTALEKFDRKLIAVEENLVQIRLTGSSLDNLRFPIKLYGKLGALASDVGNTDFPPTTQEVEVYSMFQKQLAICKSQFVELLNKDLPALNRQLKENNIPCIIAVKMP